MVVRLAEADIRVARLAGDGAHVAVGAGGALVRQHGHRRLPPPPSALLTALRGMCNKAIALRSTVLLYL